MSGRTVECILQEIDLHGLLQKFNLEKVEFDSLLNLSDNELSRLGVTTIGDRVRLREKVREFQNRDGDFVKLQIRLNDKIESLEVSSDSLEIISSNSRSVGDIGDTVGPSIVRERHMLFSSRTGRSSQKRRRSEVSCRTWTMTAMCLSDKHCAKVPTADVKEMLLKAGLGCKKIKFNPEDNLIEKICSDKKDENNEFIGFPQLKHCGGFELLRCQANSRGLTIIDCPWTVKSLKKFLGTQAKVYIRPIQQNLSTEPVRPETIDFEIKEACMKCGQMIQVQNLRIHAEVCQENLQVIPAEVAELTVESVQTDDDLYITNNVITSAPANQAVENIIHQALDQESSNVGFFQADINNNPPELHLQSDDDNVTFFVNRDDENNIQPVFNLQQSNVETVVAYAIDKMISQNIENPLEMLRYLQTVLVMGRKLDVNATDESFEGETNFINIDRENILDTAFDEIQAIQNPRLTLEVQFYNEMAVDYGGPRKEFFQLVLGAINRKYFEHGLREHMSEDYLTVGKLFGLSILQNGKIPTFINDFEEQIFSIEETDSGCIRNLRIGLDWLGIFTIGVTLPMFRHILRPTATHLTVRLLTHLLRPSFSETGSNRRVHENKVYAAFTRYMREAAGGRRGAVTLRHILKFATGAEEEPMLGFCLHPTIQFIEVSTSFVPTANTCANTLNLPTPSSDTPLPADQTLFDFYDLAFSNSYFGLM